jgi:CBS domain-containing protein
MTIYAHTLRTVNIPADIPVFVNPPSRITGVSLEDPAIRVMTDLMHTRAITIDMDQSIAFALELMKHAGVRMLVVTENSDQLRGLVTARDIMGEKPINIMNSERISRDEIRIQQIMTHVSQLQPFNISDVEFASVKDIIIKLREVGRQHAIVIEKREDDTGYFLRGIFSITQIGRQLGMDIPAGSQMQSFADFEQLLA